MKKAEFYQNLLPLDDLLPELDGKEILEIINNNEYTKDMQVDTGYPIFLYSMGYNILKQLGDLAHFGLFKIIIIITIFNTKKQRNYMIIK